MEQITLEVLAILAFVAFCAGFVDAIAGGGGMITIPTLMLCGIPPHLALGTNKLQSTFGALSATLHFYRQGLLKFSENRAFIVSAFIFSALGTIIVQFYPAQKLAKFIPILLIIFAIYFLFSPKIKEESSTARVGKVALFFVIGAVGFYDGFFGPGTGSFFMFALILLGGLGLKSSLAQAKLYNLTTNLASVAFFALGGNIIYSIGLIMAFTQFLGANLGAKVALIYGIKIIKPLVVAVSILASANLLCKEYFSKNLLEFLL